MSRDLNQNGDQKKTVKVHINRIIDEAIEHSEVGQTPDSFYKSKAEDILNSAENCFEIVTARFKNEGFKGRETIIKLLCHFPSIQSINYFKLLVQKEEFIPRIGNLILKHFNRCDVMIEAGITGNLIELDAFYQKLKNEALDNNLMEIDKISDSIINDLLKKNEGALKGIIFQLVEETGQRAAPILLKIAQTNEALASKTIKFISAYLPSETLKIIEWISSKTDNKNLIKEIRRLIHNFKLKGIEAGFKIKQAENESVLKRASIAEPSAFSSLIDPEGNRVIILLRPISSSEEKIFYFILSYEKGLLDLNILTLSKSDSNRILKKIKDDRSFFDVPTDYASFMIEKSLNNNARNSTNLPASISQWETCFCDVIGKRTAHPAKEILSDNKSPAMTLSGQEMKNFIEKYNMYVWFLSDTHIDTTFQKLKEILKSSLVLSDKVKDRMISDLINETTNGFFSPEKIETFRSMLEDIAYIMHKQGKLELSKTAMTAAAAIESPGIEPEKIPFCKNLITTAIDFMIKKSPELNTEKQDNKNLNSGIIKV